MKKALALFLLCAVLLCGCSTSPTPAAQQKEIQGVWMETIPESATGPRYTDDDETIKQVAAYLDGLKLRPLTDKDESVCGMTVRLDLLMEDGSFQTIYDNGHTFTNANGEQYVIESKPKQTLEELCKGFEQVPLIAGTVLEVGETRGETIGLLVAVDEAFHGAVGDTTSVSVSPERMFKSGYPNADIAKGDRVEFLVNGTVAESYPTRCSAARLTVSTAASGFYQQHLPAVSEPDDAYFVVFQQLFGEDTALNDSIQYISVDLTGAAGRDDTVFIQQMTAWCERQGYGLMQQTYDELVEGGWITDMYFDEGLLISFKDVRHTDTALVTEARKWRSGLGAIGATFTLAKQQDVWSITATDNQWIS